MSERCACDGQTLLEVHTTEACYDQSDVARWRDENSRARAKIGTVEAASDEVTRAYNAAVAVGTQVGESLKDARADAEYYKKWADGNGHRLNAALADAARYRLAWLSARRRAADEANFAMEALELTRKEIARLRADRATVPTLTEAERTMLTYALDQAQERIWSDDGFTDEDQAAVILLRRMADEAQQPETALRESTHAAPELEHVGTDEDGDVYRLKTF